MRILNGHYEPKVGGRGRRKTGGEGHILSADIVYKSIMVQSIAGGRLEQCFGALVIIPVLRGSSNIISRLKTNRVSIMDEIWSLLPACCQKPLPTLGVKGLLTAPCVATLLIADVVGLLTAVLGLSASLITRCASLSLSSAICASISIFRLNSCSVTRFSRAEYPFSFTE